MNSYNTDLKIFLTERKIGTLDQLAELADRYESAHSGKGTPHRSNQPPKPNLFDRPGQGNKPTHAAQGWVEKRGPAGQERKPQVTNSAHASNHRAPIRCYQCGKPGHISRECRQRQVNFVQSSQQGPLCINASVNGEQIECVLDTGLTLDALVEPGLVGPADLTGERVEVRYANGSTATLPLAEVQMNSDHIKGRVVAGVQDGMAHRMMLGCRLILPQVAKLFGPQPEINAVETRAATKGSRGAVPLLAPTIPLINTEPGEICRLQESDPSLDSVRKRVQEGTPEEGTVTFTKEKGILLRQYRGKREELSQLVVPESRRPTVLKLAHESLGSGHLGMAKTTARVMHKFYWPGVNGDVRRYVRSCDACQRLGGRKERPAPLQLMPIIDQPFKRVGVDIVGPIHPPSSRGHQYIVTTIDYATRYADAVPVRNIRTQTVAEALLTVWSRVGIPEEVLTDQGSQFIGRVMAEVNRLLSINPLKTTPYHPQTNGLVERFHGTLKGMLKRCCEHHPKEWDRYIPAMLFAYREVPQASLGFSPFELLYGRTVRGPMAILKQLWTDSESEEPVHTTYEYVTSMRDRLEETVKIAKGNLGAVQEKQSKYFNRRAKERKFALGDEVLLLLPEQHNKLQLSWKGPFTVMEVRAGRNYAIQLSPRRVKVYHVNLLKRYVRRQAEVNAVVASIIHEDDGQEFGTIPNPAISATETADDCHLCPQLNPQQQEEARAMIRRFPEVLSERPGQTQLAEFRLALTDDQPVRSRPYPLPHAKQETVRDEVREMLELGVIERVESPYAAPVVLVRKKDGSNRFCVDYRRLNARTVFHAEVMPDPEAIFAKVPRAKYFSKIDLAKGYWQIPVKVEDKAKLAFITQDGTFTWTVMPFGVKNAPSTFTVMMRRLLEPLSSHPVDNFMDDLLIATETWEEHLTTWAAVLERLREAGLTAKPSKCFLGFSELEYLGHQLAEGKVSPGKEKTQELQQAERPKTKKGVRAFLGLAGYYRKFVPNFSQLAAPLTDLLKKGQPNNVQWSQACEGGFRALKESLTAESVLKLPDLSKAFVLRTDASDTGLGAVILQDHSGVLHPVAYASRKLNQAERNYSVSERECLAIVFGTQRFQPYLYGREFVLETDHEPLSFLAQAKLSSSRLMRWSLHLQEYPMKLRYIKGSENTAADFMSRKE